MAIKSLSIRIDDEMLDKLHYVADYEARSANGQIIVLIRECIEIFDSCSIKFFFIFSFKNIIKDILECMVILL